MGLRIIVVIIAVIIGATRPDSDSVDMSAHPNSVPETAEDTDVFGQQKLPLEDEPEEDVMATGKLNPIQYPAQRAAKVVQHYLNTRYGSPFKVFTLHKVHSGNAEDVADSGRKYQLDISVQDFMSKSTANCSVEVFFPRGGDPQQHSPQVQASCEELQKINTEAQEEAFYQQYKNQSLLAAHLPDSYGHIEPKMEPLWHLGAVASSFIMLNESTENTLYNMAQWPTSRSWKLRTTS
ncbi:hypothetical protein INR49_022112 [Caranx melampygus]|nr:hypothetical protein INR49_022112 [Caranx melampygus]